LDASAQWPLAASARIDRYITSSGENSRSRGSAAGFTGSLGGGGGSSGASPGLGASPGSFFGRPEPLRFPPQPIASSAGGDLGEGRAGFVFGLEAGEGLPALDRDVDVNWRKLDREHAAASHLAGDDRGAGAAERLINGLAWRRKGFDHLLGESHGEHGRMLAGLPQCALVAHDAENAVGNLVRLYY